jgi:hypothetical protein
MQTSIYAPYSLNKLVNKQQYSITNKISCKAIGVSDTLLNNRWEQDDYIYNAMVDSISYIYNQSKPTAKDVRDALKGKYYWKTQEVSNYTTSKHFLASKFLNYKMVDARPVVEQFNEIFHIWVSLVSITWKWMRKLLFHILLIEFFPPRKKKKGK